MVIEFEDALRQIAEDGNLDADELIAYADEDTHGGRNTGHFRGDAIFDTEGRVLYALVRMLKPETCLELGVADGGSACHILSALEMNGSGKLISYDVDPDAGEKVPQDLRDRWTLIQQDVLTADFPNADFIFEDTAHTLDFSIELFRHLSQLNPRILLTHDYYTHLVYPNFAVEEAFQAVFGTEAHGVLIRDAFTGLGYWWNPERIGDTKILAIEQPLDIDSEEAELEDAVVSVKAVDKPKRGRKAAKRA